MANRGMTDTAIVAVAVLLCAAAAEAGFGASDDRVAKLNRAFLEHLASLDAKAPLAVETIRQGYRDAYASKTPAGFVPDALAVLFPEFRGALQAYDEERVRDAARLLEPLTKHPDPFLAANASYYYARALVEQNLLEEAEAFLSSLASSSDARLEVRTPYAPHVLFLLAYCEASNLRYDAAAGALRDLLERFPDAPESVTVGARQLRLELERREVGTLGEVADVMTYSAVRLDAEDAGERVRARQDEVLAMLDKLIEQAKQREQQSQGEGKQGKASPQQQPSRPRDVSEAPPSGPGVEMRLHESPKAQPGEMWGRLPPAERERILQSLKERYPSRYRQLVEQYYRSLAEQKTGP